MSKQSSLIIDKSENNADLLYKTGFFVPDPVIFIEHKDKKILVLNDLEIDRGRSEASVDTVLSLSEYVAKLRSNNKKKFNLVDIAGTVMGELKIKTVNVPGSFPVKYADQLRKSGFNLRVSKDPMFCPERLVKDAREIKNIKDSLRKTARAMDLAQRLIASSTIKKNRLYLGQKVLTSEMVKGEINAELSRLGFIGSHTIVSSGVHSSMPHHTGTGPVSADKPIIIDIFPRSETHGYFGDMTRTVIRGEPSPEIIKMYNTVLKGQKIGIEMIRDGIKGKDVHGAITEYFEKQGYRTRNLDGKPQGFIHSTGHGLGLDIHEPPRIGPGDEVLVEGNVVTVEPGLYYEKIGGVRIEDVVLVKKRGCENLTKYPKRFRLRV